MPVKPDFKAALEEGMRRGIEQQALEVEAALIGKEPLAENEVEVVFRQGGKNHMFRGHLVEITTSHRRDARRMTLQLGMDVEKEAHGR